MSPYQELGRRTRIFRLALVIALTKLLVAALSPLKAATAELVDWGSAWLTALEDELEEVQRAEDANPLVTKIEMPGITIDRAAWQAMVDEIPEHAREEYVAALRQAAEAERRAAAEALRP